MKYQLSRSSHAVYTLNYHLVMCTKYRRDVIVGTVKKTLEAIIMDLLDKAGITPIEFNADVDHIHLLFSAKPTHQISKVINSLKSVSARKLFVAHRQLKHKLWKGQFWSRSYFLATAGEVSLDVLKQYVSNQSQNVPDTQSKDSDR
ncbi:IS200/IS605 family transposase [Candidatus Poribacteria bacterium]|nr:IS200/IS605 family transposase [Candidatus Poribacteria bacterium]